MCNLEMLYIFIYDDMIRSYPHQHQTVLNQPPDKKLIHNKHAHTETQIHTRIRIDAIFLSSVSEIVYSHNLFPYTEHI